MWSSQHIKLTLAIALIQAAALGTLLVYIQGSLKPGEGIVAWGLTGVCLLGSVVLAWSSLKSQPNLPAPALSPPAKTADPHPVSTPVTHSGISPRKEMRILLVEDSPEIQIVVEDMLAQSGITVDVADNGQEGLLALTRATHDLVLMDLSMPIMDGWTAVRQIRQLPAPYNAIPIIILTANTFSGVREACMAIGAQGYLTKPVQRDLLLGSIRALLSGADPAITQLASAIIAPVDAIVTTIPLLDAAVLEQMARDTTPGLVPRMVNVFIQEASKRRERILLGVSSGDMEAIRLEIHALKSSAGTFGARALYNSSLEADLAGKNGQNSVLLKRGQELPNLIQRTIDAYQAHFPEPIHAH
ncbi:MAG: response regulator [Magnetococcales bacterium]|nr:response regulator [Magnetococcales bacterium]